MLLDQASLFDLSSSVQYNLSAKHTSLIEYLKSLYTADLDMLKILDNNATLYFSFSKFINFLLSSRASASSFFFWLNEE
jgi:hypothetical protein